MYDHTCQPEGKAPNGSGEGGAKGKPCTGCVGNADDKNPPGQSKVGPGGADHNKGYECENPRWQDKNNGVGKGNPAHSGCTPTTVTESENVCRNSNGTWSIVTIVKGTRIAGDKDAPSSGNAADCASVPPPCTVNCGPPPPCTVNCGPPPIVDCDGDGIDDNVDPDIRSCTPPPPAEDCDDDGVPDNLDTDLSECEPIERPVFCPGTTIPMPADGVCVLGETIDRDPKPVFPGGPVVGREVLGKPEVKAEASVLPFTGGNMLPFLIVSMALMGVGGVSLRRRTSLERNAA